MRAAKGTFQWLIQPGRIAATLLVATLLAGTLMMFVHQRQVEKEQIQTCLDRQTINVFNGLRENFLFNGSIVQSVAHFYHSSHHVDPDEFERFTAQSLQGDSCIRALEWVPKVDRSQREEYEQLARKRIPDFRLKRWRPGNTNSWNADPGDWADTYFPVYYLQPIASNEPALGIDLGSHPERRAALEQACKSGKPKATAGIHLAQSAADELGYLLIVPVYKNGSSVKTASERESNLLGFAVGVFDIRQIVTRVLAERDIQGINLEMADITDSHQVKTLYRDSNSGQYTSSTVAPTAVYLSTIGGREWQFTFTALPEYIESRQGVTSWVFLMSGTTISFLVGAFVYVLLRSEHHVQDLVHERTEQLKELATALDEAHDCVFICDPNDMRFVYANKGATQQVGYTKEELLCMRPANINPEHDDWKVRVLFDTLVQAPGTPHTLRTTHKHRDGHLIPVEVNLQFVKELGENGRCVAIVRDISEQLKQETQVIQSRKLEAIGRLSAGIAHEINTPLQFVGANIEYLASSTPKMIQVVESLSEQITTLMGEKAEEVIEPLLKEHRYRSIVAESPAAVEDSMIGIKRVTDILRAMRDLTHPGIKGWTTIDLNQLLESASVLTKNRWKEIAHVELDLSSEPLEVQCSSAEISQVAINLIVNATDAINETRLSDESLGSITIKSGCNGEMAFFECSDSGPGIPQDVVDHIFDPFFTTKEVGKGTGQGLAICYDIVTNKHGGSISVHSDQGQGATFRVQIPISQPEIEDREQIEALTQTDESNDAAEMLEA